MKLKFTFIILGVMFIAFACQKNNEDNKVYQYQTLNLPPQADNYKADFNAAFGTSKVVNLTTTNAITNDGAALGRVLFYDKLLSLNNTTACASCHQQSAGFSDGGAQFSVGFEGNITSRNSMSIANTADNGFYFWDGRSTTLEDLALQPVRNHVELGLNKIANLETKLANAPYYSALFEKAFGDKTVTRERVSKALSQFLHSMTSRNSKFDEGLKSNFTNYTPAEKRGEVLFAKTLYCGQCHNGTDLDSRGSSFTATGTTNSWNSNQNNLNKQQANVGLEKNYIDDGMGLGSFKVPSLRNVTLTAPYMHDGRFKTLEEVINHYSDGVQNHPNLDSRIRDFNKTRNWNGGGQDTTQNRHIRLALSTQDKSDLISFLKTLTDNKFITDSKFSNPFK
jgi:cytochrome c peroxidase